MGDIRLAEKALEGGMTLEGYFRSVKGEDARGTGCPPQRELEGTTEALLGSDSYGQQSHQLSKRLDDGSRSLWSSELTCSSPQAIVGLGGIPLERDVEEEFSFLEETEFLLRSDPRGKGLLPGKGGSLREPTKARAQAATAAAAAAAHAAAVAPSNPGAASVAAWFTTMLAAPPESSNSPDWYNKAPLKAGNQTPKPKEEGGILKLFSQNAGGHRQDPILGQQQREGGVVSQQRDYAHVAPQPQFGFQQQHTQQQHHVHQQKQQIHQQQLYLQYQQRQLNQQQAMARRPRGQPLDAVQGREAGRQLLSLIGVVPRSAAEEAKASPSGVTSPPFPQGPAFTPYPLAACEDPIPKAAADLERQLLQRSYNLQEQPQMQQLQQQQAFFQQPQQQHMYMQQHRPYVQAPPVNPQFPPGASGPPLQPGRLPSRGATPVGRLMESPGEYVASSVSLNRPQGPRGSSGEKNLLKLLHAGGGTFHGSSESPLMPPPGPDGGGAIIKREETRGPF